MYFRGFAIGDHILPQSADIHPDWCAAYGRLGVYRFVGASAAGKLHLRDKRPRDDAFVIRSAGSWLAAAVADGLGSRPHSRYGSAYAVEALCEFLLRKTLEISPHVQGREEKEYPSDSENTSEIKAGIKDEPYGFNPQEIIEEASCDFGTLIWYRSLTSSSQNMDHPNSDEGFGEPAAKVADLEKYVRQAFQQTHAGLRQYAHSRSAHLSDFHCTLMGLLLNTKTGQLAAGHVGDGLVLALNEKGEAFPLVEPPTTGEVGATYLLTQPDWEKYLAIRTITIEECESIKTLYLMSDGIADDCMYGPPPDILQRWTQDINKEVRQYSSLLYTATRLLRWIAYYEVKGSWDDRTLVVVFR